MEASHDGQRRVIAPHGVHGGLDGERGASYLQVKKASGGTRIVKLKPAAQVKSVVQPFIIFTLLMTTGLERANS